MTSVYKCDERRVSEAEVMSGKSWSRSHVTTIIQNFILVSLTSFVAPHPAGLTLGAVVPSFPTHLFSYAFVSLYTHLLTHSSLYTLVLSLRPCTNRENIPLRYVSEIVHLSSHHSQSSQYATRKLSCRLDAIDALPLCGSQPRHQSTRVTGWMTSGHLQYVISSMTKDHLQYAIEYSGKLAPWRRSDGYPPSVCHQVSQQWLDGEGVTDIYPLVGYQYWPEPWPDDEGKLSGLAMLARW